MNDDTLDQIGKDITKLAKTLFKNNTKRAIADGQAFLDASKTEVAIWLKQLAEGKITQKNFESLVRGERDLAKMESLRQAGMAQVAIDTFTRGVIDIIINAALATI